MEKNQTIEQRIETFAINYGWILFFFGWIVFLLGVYLESKIITMIGFGFLSVGALLGGIAKSVSEQS